MLMISVDEVMNILEEYAVCTPDEEKSLIQRINQASMFIDNIGTVSKWVRVEDRLPDKDYLYIVCRTFAGHQIVFAALWENKKFISVVEHNPLEYITHWMPLPKPPESE